MSAKLAYVTGGMGGIGTAICQRLAKEGMTVVAGCGPSRDFDKWLGEQKAMGYTFYASVGNVSDWDSTVEAFKAGAIDWICTIEPYASALVADVKGAVMLTNGVDLYGKGYTDCVLASRASLRYSGSAAGATFATSSSMTAP